MTITGGTKLASDEIDRMVKEAEAHANEDKARRDKTGVPEAIEFATKRFKERGQAVP